MKKFNSIVFLLPIILIAGRVFAQSPDEVTISGDFSSLNFRQFVNAVESKTPFRFFYNPATLDTLRIDLPSQDRSLSQLMLDAFRGTDVRYAFSGRSIFVVRGRLLQDHLPDDFFSRGAVAAETRNDKVLSEYLESEKLKKVKATAEEKLYKIGIISAVIGSGSATIAGHVRAFESGEPIVGASISTEITGTGIATDQFGYYALTLPKGPHELKIKSVGMKNTRRGIVLYSDGQLDIDLQEEVTALREVTIEADKDKNVSGMQMGLEKLDIKTMKKIPVVLGEVDILKVALTLPGVQTVGEGTAGLNVRGGATNQNLILFNDAVIYNPTHLFGFFSAFNPDVVKSVELYKSGIPAEYGGRLSSVLDVTTRDGNKKKFSGSGGIGPITGRLSLEGPIIKDKTSFLIGGRSTYSDWLLKQVPNASIAKSQASFYDYNANLNHEFNSKNTVYLSGYISQDHFKLHSDTSYTYRNKNATAKWKHIFGNTLYGVLTGAYSGYDYKVSSDKNPVNAFDLGYSIDQVQVKADFNYYPIPHHGINFGASSIRYHLSPGHYLPHGDQSQVTADYLQNEQAQESALYISDHVELTPRVQLYAGLRYSYYNYLGARDVYAYAPGLPKSTENIQDTIHYKSGKSIIDYNGPEYRVSVNYLLPGNASLKLGFNRMRQYLQMLSNTAAISPTDIWKLSDTNIKPQIGDQIAGGIYKNFRSNTIETSIEGYYKSMENSLDYKGGAQLIMNHHIETDIVSAHGKAYGVEFMVKKMTGKVNGWVSYTYSRSFLQTRSAYSSETINNGNYYRSNYDKPHAINLISNYRFSHRFSTSFNMTYSTGRPITLPIAKYDLGGVPKLFYSDRNQYRIPDYFRMDIGLNIEGNHKIRKLAHSSWTISVYNLTGRKNAYSIFFQSENGQIKGYKLSIFGSAIPTVTYNFRF